VIVIVLSVGNEKMIVSPLAALLSAARSVPVPLSAVFVTMIVPAKPRKDVVAESAKASVRMSGKPWRRVAG
jgi:hypothetical protein